MLRMFLAVTTMALTVWTGTINGADVTVRNAPYNGTLALDGATTFGLLVATSVVPDALTLTCER